ncbi:hypothetical protein Ccrd_016238 [Cynara cardunculus var. scolymus]|uniref:Bet v I/Major latex protein domain-containing protein n=1 Tax=Cynara cardunculus var. scolymus TaxID=59895 RepID=A0A118K369_CYNCS|nr:hypothetical protein Ccrd_016238 [Cynara cardunculus var. scolymus]
MADLNGTLVKQVTIKSDGDVFHEIFRQRPHHISEMSPDHIKCVDLHEGEWGVVGSVIGGDILEAYKTFLITVHVETTGEENVVTWTFHYEKLNDKVEDPDSLMDFCLRVTKDIENHHLTNSTEDTENPHLTSSIEDTKEPSPQQVQ